MRALKAPYVAAALISSHSYSPVVHIQWAWVWHPPAAGLANRSLVHLCAVRTHVYMHMCVCAIWIIFHSFSIPQPFFSPEGLLTVWFCQPAIHMYTPRPPENSFVILTKYHLSSNLANN